MAAVDLPPIVSLVPRRFEDRARCGVARFDWELRRIIPGLISLNTRPFGRALLWLQLRRRPDTIVIAGNETSLLVPNGVRTIVVHHGCAQTHFDRDPEWRDAQASSRCDAQKAMYHRKNRWFVALAEWTAQEFSRHHGVPRARVIPCWVPPIARPARPPAQLPVVMGDWRNFNKGRDQISDLVAALPQFEFRQLRCTYETREAVYSAADVYLCLSLSEGGSYSLSDAEAAGLPIVSTKVGNHLEYGRIVRLNVAERTNTTLVGAALQQALSQPEEESFFDQWSLADWRHAWLSLLTEVARSPIEAAP